MVAFTTAETMTSLSPYNYIIIIIIIIIIINNHDDIYSTVIYGASHMQKFTVVPLGQSRSAPGGRQLVGQAANLTFESSCRLL